MRKLVIGMAMASSALASPALARDGQWYIEAQGGPMIVEDMDFDVTDGTDSDTSTADLDAGFDFGGVVGYDFGWLRLEADASYREADFDTIFAGSQVGIQASNVTNRNGRARNGTFDADGNVNVLSFMVNALADFGDDDGIQGFVGGGVGVARTDMHSSIDASGPGAFDDSDSGFAWQALAGVRAPLTDSIDVGLRYRFFNAENVRLVDTAGYDLDTRFRSHSILGTFTFNFGGAPEQMQTCYDGSVISMDESCPARPVPPPPPPVTPPPPPPPVCNKGPYIVFFDWDKSDITPEAATILDNAVSAYTKCGTAAVMLAGHTDRSGTATYNMGLAGRRNDSVRSYLTGRGIPDGRMSSEAFGETMPRVPTADGVREPQNRRVEITYGPGSGM